MSYYDINIFASFPPEAILDPQQGLEGLNNVSTYLNVNATSQTGAVSAHVIQQITNLSITSNGIDGFNIFPIKFATENINFVAKLKDLNGYDVKDWPLLDLNSFTFALCSSNGNITNGVSFSSNFGTLSSLTQGGFFKGYVKSNYATREVRILANYNYGGLNVTGYSSPFTVYPLSGQYNIRKVNEDFDQAAAFQSLAYQPVMIDKRVFFDQFLGQIVGNSNSDPNTLGIEVYEKITNYVSNIADSDYCNVDSLKSLLDELKVTYQNFDYTYPASLKRLVDILSVKHKLLFGQANQYQGNFNDKGFTNSDTYGLNRGSIIPFETITTVIPEEGDPIIIVSPTRINPNTSPPYIITYEKFSGIYNLVSKIISPDNPTATYDLSAVNSSWGWNLVIPPNTSGYDVGKYYDFYQFVPGVEGSLLQKFIDFDNPNNTLKQTNSSYSAYIQEGGIIDSLLVQNMLSNLQILSS